MNFSVMSEADCLRKIRETKDEPSSVRRATIECIAGLTACQDEDVKRWIASKGLGNYIPYWRDPEKVRSEAKKRRKEKMEKEISAEAVKEIKVEEAKAEEASTPSNIAFDSEVVVNALHGYIDGMIIRAHKLREQRESIAKEIEKLEVETEKALAILEAYEAMP